MTRSTGSAVTYGWLDYWRSPYDVPEAYEVKCAPRYIEATARQSSEPTRLSTTDRR